MVSKKKKESKAGRHANRSNQWIAGTCKPKRSKEVFCFKPRLEVIEAIKGDMESRGLSKSEWLDEAIAFFLENASK